ncbi:VPS9 domain, partial [Trinorchestia longiramus]
CDLRCRLLAQYVDELCDVTAIGLLNFSRPDALNIIKKFIPSLLAYLPSHIKPKCYDSDHCCSLPSKCDRKENERSKKTGASVSSGKSPPTKRNSEHSLERGSSSSGMSLDSEYNCRGDFDCCRTAFDSIKDSEANAVFEWLLLRPVEMINAYECLLCEVLKDGDKRPKKTLFLIKEAQKKWRQVQLLATKAFAEAKTTLQFWQSLEPRSVSASPTWRLTLDSRHGSSARLMSSANSGFLASLTSAGYVALTSAALLQCGGVGGAYPLQLLWLQAPPQHNSIQLLHPEDTLTLTFTNTADCRQWYAAITAAIAKTCSKNRCCNSSACSSRPESVLQLWLSICNKGATSRGSSGVCPPRYGGFRTTNAKPDYAMSGSNLDRPPVSRKASYYFTKHPLYKTATYEGDWVSGKPHGVGVMTWGDGRVYTGGMKSGQFWGAGELRCPSGSLISNYFPMEGALAGASLCSGDWVAGKMSGWGEIYYHDGSMYSGYLENNLYEKHGVLQRGRFSTSSLDRFSDFLPNENPTQTNKISRETDSIGQKPRKTTKRNKDTKSSANNSKDRSSLESKVDLAASVYTGEWSGGLKHGYGIEDFICSGAKYQGQYHLGERHGSGIVTTIGGSYYETCFVHGRPQGSALAILEDGTIYDGELGRSPSSSGGLGPLVPYCSGRGTLFYSQGDCIEGVFSGPLFPGTGGLKISSATFFRKYDPGELAVSKFSVLGTHSGSVCCKWDALFTHYLDLLGIPTSSHLPTPSSQVWQRLVGYISGCSSNKPDDNIATVPMIPVRLCTTSLLTIQRYLAQVLVVPATFPGTGGTWYLSWYWWYLLPFLVLVVPATFPGVHRDVRGCTEMTGMCPHAPQAFRVHPHPLAELLSALVASFRAAFSTGAPALLLPHALAQIQWYTSRLYLMVRALFPVLPPEGTPVYLDPPIEGAEKIVVTSSCIIHTHLLPHLYSSLSTLYVLCGTQPTHTSTQPTQKLHRLPQYCYPLPPYAVVTTHHTDSTQHANSTQHTGSTQHTDSTQYTGRLHPIHRGCVEATQASDAVYWANLCAWNKLCDIQILERLEVHRSVVPPDPGAALAEAVEIFQLLPTAFLPRAKLTVVQLSFRSIRRTLQCEGSQDVLLPVFVYAVLRARVQRLGVELQLMEDLLEAPFKSGELHYMFTSLCVSCVYFCVSVLHVHQSLCELCVLLCECTTRSPVSV